MACLAKLRRLCEAWPHATLQIQPWCAVLRLSTFVAPSLPLRVAVRRLWLRFSISIWYQCHVHGGRVPGGQPHPG